MNQSENYYEKSRKFNNLEETAYNYGLKHETWCEVEKSNNEAHTRVKRRHFGEFNNSVVFGVENVPGNRSQSLIASCVPRYAEKRHYPELSNTSCLSRIHKPKE